MSSSNKPKVSPVELLKAQMVIAEAKKDASGRKAKGQKSKGQGADENTPPEDVKPKGKASPVE